MTDQQKIDYICTYVHENRSIKTTAQMFNHFLNQDLKRHLIYAFPNLYKGEVLSFETLLSKKFISTTMLERFIPENQDIVNEIIRKS